jgi:hypothetical protein
MLASGAFKFMKNQKNHKHPSYFHLHKGVEFLLAPGVKFSRFGTVCSYNCIKGISYSIK